MLLDPCDEVPLLATDGKVVPLKVNLRVGSAACGAAKGRQADSEGAQFRPQVVLYTEEQVLQAVRDAKGREGGS